MKPYELNVCMVNLKNSIVDADNAQSTLNSVTDIAVAALEREQTIRKEIVQELGQVGTLQQMQNQNIEKDSQTFLFTRGKFFTFS